MITAWDVQTWFAEASGQKRKRPLPAIQDCEIIASLILHGKNNPPWELYAAQILEARRHAGQLLKSLVAARRLYEKLDGCIPDMPGDIVRLEAELDNFQIFSDVRVPLDLPMHAHIHELMPPYCYSLAKFWPAQSFNYVRHEPRSDNPGTLFKFDVWQKRTPR